jgi:nucleoside-diphosphate-sugar epimerase
VIHCAGATRALDAHGFFEVNEAGTRHVVEAVNRHGGIRRLVHISSLAAVGAATRERPLTDTDPTRPNSTYGLSKLAAEDQVRERCHTEYTILRPPAVYGPRDREFLRLFKTVRAGFKPVFGDGSQLLNFVYAPDLARAAVHCLTAPGASGQSFFVAEPTRVSSLGFGELVSEVLGRRTRVLRIPVWAVYALCLGQDLASQVTRKASVLSRHKFGEFRAEALTCDATPLRDRTGFSCPTDLKTGLLQTLEWYRGQGWLP